MKPLKAVRLYCLYCMNNQPGEIKNCPSGTCPFYYFRFGRNESPDKKTALQAIKKYCFDCSNNSYEGVKKCDFTECSLYIFRFGENPHRVGIGRRMDEIKQVFCKRINKTKSKDYPIPQYGINGKLIGYEESDEHFRNRVLKAIEGNKE